MINKQPDEDIIRDLLKIIRDCWGVILRPEGDESLLCATEKLHEATGLLYEEVNENDRLYAELIRSSRQFFILQERSKL